MRMVTGVLRVPQEIGKSGTDWDESEKTTGVLISARSKSEKSTKSHGNARLRRPVRTISAHFPT